MGGLRRGEILALRPGDVDLADGVIRVERNLDEIEGEVLLKTRAGRRKVPIAAVLRDYLAEAVLSADDDCRLFRFDPRKLTKRSDGAWAAADLKRITLHECRPTFASLMIAAGVNAKALSTFMGHANIKVTLDTYGHLMPGSESEAAGLLDAYLAAQQEREEEAARRAGSGLIGEPVGERVARSGG